MFIIAISTYDLKAVRMEIEVVGSFKLRSSMKTSFTVRWNDIGIVFMIREGNVSQSMRPQMFLDIWNFLGLMYIRV